MFKPNVMFDVKVPMRDGVKLSANVYFPKGDGPFPVVMNRTPYVKDSAARSPTRNNARLFAEAGYAVVHVNDGISRFSKQPSVISSGRSRRAVLDIGSPVHNNGKGTVSLGKVHVCRELHAVPHRYFDVEHHVRFEHFLISHS